MKQVKLRLYFCLCLFGLLTQARADDRKPVVLPDEVQVFAPDMVPRFFTADGADAVMVVETVGQPPRDPYARQETRWLILLRKERGKYREVDRSDKIIACSTCEENGFDPFFSDGITLKRGKLNIQQSYGDNSHADYAFSYNFVLGHWVVVSAVNTDVDLNMSNGALKSTPHRLKLPTPALLVNFDPAWQPKAPSVAIVVNDKTGNRGFPSGNTVSELEASIKDSCTSEGLCHEVGRVINGCIALVRDGEGKFYVGKSAKIPGPSKDDLRAQEAQNQAQNECRSNGNNTCTVLGGRCSF